MNKISMNNSEELREQIMETIREILEIIYVAPVKNANSFVKLITYLDIKVAQYLCDIPIKNAYFDQLKEILIDMRDLKENIMNMYHIERETPKGTGQRLIARIKNLKRNMREMKKVVESTQKIEEDLADKEKFQPSKDLLPSIDEDEQIIGIKGSEFLPSKLQSLYPSLKNLEVNFSPPKTLTMEIKIGSQSSYKSYLKDTYFKESERDSLSFGYGDNSDNHIADARLSNPQFYIHHLNSSFYISSVGKTSLLLKLRKGWLTQITNRDCFVLGSNPSTTLTITECKVHQIVTNPPSFVLCPRVMLQGNMERFQSIDSEACLTGIINSSEKTGKKIYISEGSMTIGSNNTQADSCVLSQTVSPIHCYISYKNEIGWYIIDVSETGTYLKVQKDDLEVDDQEDYYLPLCKGMELSGGSCTEISFH